MPTPPPIPGPTNPYSNDHRCPKCGRTVQPDGFCMPCGTNRVVKMALWLVVGAPILGFGACLGLLYSQVTGEALFGLILILMIGGPVVGFLYLIIGLIVNARRGRR